MKKILAWFLVLVLITCSLTSAIFTSASAEGNLWTSIVKDDVKSFTGYGEFKSFTAETGTLVLQTIRYQSVYVKMPALEANTTYQLAMDYTVSSAESQSGMRILNAEQLESMISTKTFPATTVATVFASGSSGGNDGCIFTTDSTTDYYLAIRCVNIGTNGATLTLSGIELKECVSYDVEVENGQALVNGLATDKATVGSTVTLKATPEEGKAFSKWQVVSGDIQLVDKNASTTTFTMPEGDVSIKAVCKDNLWLDPTEGFKGQKDATTISYKSANGYYQVEQCWWTAFSFKLPSGLSADKTYRLSFEHRLRAGNAENGKVRYMNLTTDSKVGDTTPVYGQSLMNGYTVSDTFEQVVYEFSGTADQLYLYMYMDYVDWARFRNFSLIEVDYYPVTVEGGSADNTRATTDETITITADTPLGKQFKEWQVIKGDVELANKNASPTTFTMTDSEVVVKAVFENCSNMWQGLNPDNFTKISQNPTFTLNDGVVEVGSPWYSQFRVDMPTLEKNTIYRLSFDYKVVQNPSMAGIEKPFQTVRLVTEADYQQQLIDRDTVNNGTFDCNSRGRSVLNQAETTGEWESLPAYEFDSGNNTDYCILIGFKYVTAVSLRNFVIEKIATNVAPEFDANLGAVTPTSVRAEVGNELTFTAKPHKGNYFDGWYTKGGTLISNDPVLNFLVDDGFESPSAKFKAGNPAVENASMEDSSGLLVDVDDNNQLIQNDPLYTIQTADSLSWQEIRTETKYARTGSKSLWIYTLYSYAGRGFKNLEKNTDYAISFWVYGAHDCKLSLASYVLPAGLNAVEGKKHVVSQNAIGKGKTITPGEEWQEVVINFNSGDNTEVWLWLNSSGSGSYLFVDDFALYRPASIGVTADLGGIVSASDTGSLAVGTKVTLTATPNNGNNFKHWIDGEGNVISTESTFVYTVEKDIQLKAVFDGYNKPGRELFIERGQDGTFERGTISGWHATSREGGGSVPWCTWQRSTDMAYEGEYSLKVYSIYQNSVLPLTGLNENTNYKFSFYVNYPEYEGMEDEDHKGPDGVYVNSRAVPFGIIDAESTQYEKAAKIYANHPYSMPCGGGWYKVELYFNTGDATAVNFTYAYYGVSVSSPNVYFDNISLFEYTGLNELTNADFADGIAPWLGDGVVENEALKLDGVDATAYQILALGENKKYTVSFRAKGKVLAAASDVAASIPDLTNTLSTQSYLITDSQDWKEYSFEIYTGVHPHLNLMFASYGDLAFVDDITLTEISSPVGGIVEKIDFETERFALRDENSAYEIYTATSANDDKVYSGSRSLRFKANSVDGVATILDEAFLCQRLIANVNYRLTLYYRLDGNGSVYIAPNRAAYYTNIYENNKYGEYCADDGYIYSGTEWQKLQFTFTAEANHVIKTIISNVLGGANNDFYIDDITLTVAPDLIIDPNTDNSFCEEFFNVIKNGSFENDITDADWKELFDANDLVTNKNSADTGKKYLSIKKGKRYVMPITLQAGKVYYFGASVRGDGRVAIATQTDPAEIYYLDAANNDAPASIVAADGNEWYRRGFSFRASASGVGYLIMEGDLDVDTLSLCLEGFEYTIDPNRYEPPVPFDYDNIDPSLLVYNGGFDDYNADGTPASPATGDSPAGAVAMLLICLVAAATLVLLRRKEARA